MLARRRHLWPLFCLLLSVLASATMSHAQALAMTNISDVVYRADGTPASGVLLISWPAFSTSDGKPSRIRHEKRHAGSTRGAVSIAGAERWSNSRGHVLHRGVPTQRYGKDRILDRRNNFSDNYCSSSHDPGYGVGSTDGFQAIRGQRGWKQSDGYGCRAQKAGVEAISGTKQFSTPPSVPAPALASMTESIASRDIADEEKFKEGLAKVIDGTVECLNASIWAKANQP